MKKSLMFTLAIVTILFACENDALQEDLLSNTEGNDTLQVETFYEPLVDYDGSAYLPDYQYNIYKEDKDKSRPLNFRMIGTTKFQPSDEPCGGYIDVIWQGHGTVSPFGSGTFYAHYYCHDGTTPALPVTGKLTFLKRGELYLMMYYSGGKGVYNNTQEWIIYDGTGIYKNAYGELTLTQSLNKDLLSWSLTGSGSVNY